MGLPGQAKLPVAFNRTVPSNRGLFTPGGHLIEMDDGESNPTKTPNDKDLTTKSRGIRITSKDGYKIHIAEDLDNGKQEILIEAKDGSLIKIDVENGELLIHAEGKHTLTVVGDTKMTSGGSHIIEAASTKLDAASNEITGSLTVGGAASLQSTLQVTGSSQLGGGTPLVLSTAQFIGTGNLGAPVISTIMSGQATKASGA